MSRSPCHAIPMSCKSIHPPYGSRLRDRPVLAWGISISRPPLPFPVVAALHFPRICAPVRVGSHAISVPSRADWLPGSVNSGKGRVPGPSRGARPIHPSPLVHNASGRVFTRKEPPLRSAPPLGGGAGQRVQRPDGGIERGAHKAPSERGSVTSVDRPFINGEKGGRGGPPDRTLMLLLHISMLCCCLDLTMVKESVCARNKKPRTWKRGHPPWARSRPSPFFLPLLIYGRVHVSSFIRLGT